MKNKFSKLFTVVLALALLLPTFALVGCKDKKLSKELNALIGTYQDVGGGINSAVFTEEGGKVYGTYIGKQHVEITYTDTDLDVDGSVLCYNYSANGDLIEYDPETKILRINASVYRKQ